MRACAFSWEIAKQTQTNRQNIQTNQEARSDALAQEARATAAEAEAERMSEQAAVYKEAYQTRRRGTLSAIKSKVSYDSPHPGE